MDLLLIKQIIPIQTTQREGDDKRHELYLFHGGSLLGLATPRPTIHGFWLGLERGRR